MCQAKKTCRLCDKKLTYNNKVGFCINCVPKDRIFNLFMKGKTIQDISNNIYSSQSGYYRSLIRKTLTEKLDDKKFNKIKTSNRNKIMKKREVDLPLNFIYSLYEKGKTAPEINKALASKGYTVHTATVRKRLKEKGLDLMENLKRKNIKLKRISKKRKRLIKELWLDGNNMKSISKVTGMAENTIKIYLHQMGFKTKLFQNYILKNYTEGEKTAKPYFKNNGYKVKKCYFLCQRKNNEGLIIPKELKSFCEKCPIKKLNFKHREFYDFVIEKDGRYSIVEVKKVYISKNWERAHFSIGQFINLPEILKNKIPFHLILIRGGKIEETIF